MHEHLPPKHDPFLDLVPPQGIRLTPRHYAYLKISEGCNNKCSFCIIPSMRGLLASRPIDEVLREGEKLARAGVREMLVISQDTSAYGVDIRYREARVARPEIRDAIPGSGARPRRARHLGPHALRVSVSARRQRDPADGRAQGAALSRHPVPARQPDGAEAHAAARARWRRRWSAFKAWREVCPDLTIRSTFIVGFPGETEAEFEELLAWLDEAQLDRVGAFKYSPVEGAAANDVAPHVRAGDPGRAPRALHAEVRRASARRSSRRKVGQRMHVLVDAIDGNIAIARSEGDAPEIDGVVRIAQGRQAPSASSPTSRSRAPSDHDLEAKSRQGALSRRCRCLA